MVSLTKGVQDLALKKYEASGFLPKLAKELKGKQLIVDHNDPRDLKKVQ
jgi:hypothetical protein